MREREICNQKSINPRLSFYINHATDASKKKVPISVIFLILFAPRIQDSPFPSSSHSASFNIFSVGLDGIQKIRFAGLLSAEENHRIVMKPAPIMEAGKEEADEQDETKGEVVEDQEQTKKKDLQ